MKYKFAMKHCETLQAGWILSGEISLHHKISGKVSQ